MKKTKINNKKFKQLSNKMILKQILFKTKKEKNIKHKYIVC